MKIDNPIHFVNMGLSFLEARILFCVYEKRGEVVSSAKIAKEIKGSSNKAAQKKIQSAVARINKKFVPVKIHTGYFLPLSDASILEEKHMELSNE